MSETVSESESDSEIVSAIMLAPSQSLTRNRMGRLEGGWEGERDRVQIVPIKPCVGTCIAHRLGRQGRITACAADASQA